MNTKELLKWALVASVAIARPAMADAQDGDVYLSFLTSKLEDNSTKGYDSALGYQLSAGWVLSQRWNIEGFFNQFHPKNGAGAQDQHSYGIDVQRVFKRKNKVTSYLAFGAGTMDVDLDAGASDRTTFLKAGIGILAELDSSNGRRPALRLELGYRNDDAFSMSGNDRFISLGLQIPIGRGETPMVDTDGDGVIDALDQCPNTPRGAMVDSRGCPLP